MGAVQSMVRQCFNGSKEKETEHEFDRSRTFGNSIVKEDPDGPLDATSREYLLDDSIAEPQKPGRSKTMDAGREKMRILNETFDSVPLLDEVDGVEKRDDRSSESSNSKSSLEEHSGIKSEESESEKSKSSRSSKTDSGNDQDDDYDLPKPYQESAYDLPAKDSKKCLERLNSDYDYPNPHNDTSDMPMSGSSDQIADLSVYDLPKSVIPTKVDSDYDELPVKKLSRQVTEEDYDELPVRNGKTEMTGCDDYDELPTAKRLDGEYDELPNKEIEENTENDEQDYDVPRNWKQ